MVLTTIGLILMRLPCFTAPIASYSVDPLFYPNGLTKTGMSGGPPSLWFNVTTNSTEAQCINSINSFCGEPPFNEIIEDEEEFISSMDLWAADDLEDPTLNVLHWEARYDLFVKLHRNPNLREENPNLETLFESMEVGNAGVLADTDLGIESIYMLNNDEREILLNSLLEALINITPENELYSNLININIFYIYTQ